MRRAAICLIALGATACNIFTGADGLSVGEDEGGADGGGAGQVTSSGAGAAGEGGGHAGADASGGQGQGGQGEAGQAVGGAGGGGTNCPPCGANQHCEVQTASCVCDPGFIFQGGQCNAAPVGDPSTHSEAEVCQQWSDGHVVTTPNPVVASGADCDAGELMQGGITDTLARINMFRWLVGLGPTTDDAGYNAGAQLCANLEAWWTFQGGSAHSPPPSSTCYTAEGAATAGQSNIAWGSGHPAQAIDQFIQDNGNDTTMGHRRWILNPPLGPVGIGYWETGGIYGNAECLRVFGSSGGGPNPAWTAFPNPGFTPIAVTSWTWTFHGTLSGIANAQISVLRVDDNTPLSVAVQTLSQGFAQTAISFNPDGWSTEAGKTYRVTVSGLGGGDVVYDVKPINCP